MIEEVSSIELLRVMGASIRTSRIGGGLTQQELGARAGLGGKYVSEIERGNRDVPMSTLYSIVEGLGLRLTLEFRPKSGSRPHMRLPLPKPVEDVAQMIAALAPETRTRVLAIVRGLLGLLPG